MKYTHSHDCYQINLVVYLLLIQRKLTKERINEAFCEKVLIFRLSALRLIG
jgi:hypothetical protein